MTISHLLEDFSSSSLTEGPIKLMSEDALEDHHLASFEQGYTAGWNDAIAAQAQDQTKITGALARSLEDLSFTYHEAYVQMLASVEPVFRSLIKQVLPQVMVQSFGHRIVEQLSEMTAGQISQPVALVVPPGAATAIKPILAKELPIQVDLIEDASVIAGQAQLRVGDAERELDGDQVLTAITKSIDAFFYQTSKETQHG